MSRVYGSAVLVIALATSSHAIGASFVGSYAFDWLKSPGKTRCVRIDNVMDADLQSNKYRCSSKPQTNTSTGAPARTCKSSNEKIEYLIFTSKSLCEEERKTQESNE